MRAERFAPSADRAAVRLIGGVVLALVALGSTAGQGWAQPGSGSGTHGAADYTPVTATVRGRVGDTVVVRLGVANLGPGAPAGGAPGTFAVVPPAGTTITSIPWEGDDDDRRYACRPPQDEDNPFFLCDLSEWPAPAPGASITLGFHIRIDRRIPGAEGSLTVYGPHDPVPGNDSAAIRVRAAPAPPLRWQQGALAAGALAAVVTAGGWFVRRRRRGMS
ncbi:hypothetical protein [Streptomyces griseoruber]|uniref:DUF11 domain-containing protein n=1 Tax=Streptomyces griseoruber TaxID=1943 RepID=A0A101T4Q6_9ACTN|nr:hypothetical protein [Streptomyces griseoruber]KUN85734.1 hypothetical protein AQJ64_11545 [Streptomyces griseoruber]